MRILKIETNNNIRFCDSMVTTSRSPDVVVIYYESVILMLSFPHDILLYLQGTVINKIFLMQFTGAISVNIMRLQWDFANIENFPVRG